MVPHNAEERFLSYPNWRIGYCIIIFGVIAGVAAFFPGHANAASIFFSPTANTVSVGQSVTLTVEVSSPDQAMNAVSGDISFPSNKLQILSISKAGSLLSLWVRDPSFSNSASAGTAHFEGIVLNPGFTGSNGTILSVTFQAVANGTASVTLSAGSVLANDGNGTNILTSLGTATLTITPRAAAVGSLQSLPAAPVVTSPTHPSEHSWYSTTTLQLAWDLPQDANGIDYALVTSSDYLLPLQAKPVISGITYDIASSTEGPWYFYIKYRNQSGWGPTTVRGVNMDFSPPEPFRVTEAPDQDPANEQPIFMWQATDTVSGIAQYLLKIGDGEWFDASAIRITGSNDEYRLPPQFAGKNVLLSVKAIDEAGNSTIATTTFTVAPSSAGLGRWFVEMLGPLLVWLLLVLVFLLALFLVLLVTYLLRHRFRLWRLSLDREIIQSKKELRDEVKEIAETLITYDSAHPNLTEREKRAYSELERVEADLKEEINKIDKGEEPTLPPPPPLSPPPPESL